jgi:hypothetical protein
VIKRSLPSSRWPIRFIAIVTALFGAPAADAALVYALVDYPDLQNGYRLSGSITVSDSAAIDGLLDEHEVQDWVVRLEGRTQVTATKQPGTRVQISNIGISQAGITLPIDQRAYFYIWTTTYETPNLLLTNIAWETVAHSNSTYNSSFYTAGHRLRDSITPYWYSDIKGTLGPNVEIARTIPEVVPYSPLILTMGIRRRVSRVKQKTT